MYRITMLAVVILSILGITLIKPVPVHADDKGPECTQTYKENSDGSRSVGQPLCTEDWALSIWDDYLYHTLGQIGVAKVRLNGSYVNRVIRSKRLDQTGKQEVITSSMFSTKAAYYGVGADITWGPGDSQDECGFIMNKADDGNYNVLGINQMGQAVFLNKTGGQWKADQTRNISGIKVGSGARNRVMALQFHARYFLFVNGKLATSFDSTDRQDSANSAGLAAHTHQNQRRTTFCKFDGAWFWQINDWTLKK